MVPNLFFPPFKLLVAEGALIVAEVLLVAEGALITMQGSLAPTPHR